MTPYEKICFALESKQKELEEIKLDIFTHNPKIKQLVAEIEALEKTKKSLEGDE